MGGKLTIEDLLELQTVSDVEVSADGQRIAFVVRPSSYAKGTAPEGAIWVSDDGGDAAAGDARPRQRLAAALVADGTHARVRLGPRPRRAALAATCSTSRGEARPLGEVEGSIEAIRWSADGSSLLVLAADPGSDRAGGQSATKIEAKDAEAPDPVVRRPKQSWRRLYRDRPRERRDDRGGPRGRQRLGVRLARRGRGRRGRHRRAERERVVRRQVAILDLGAALEPGRTRGRVAAAVAGLSPDGSQVAFVEGFNSDRPVIAGTITVVPSAGGTATAVAPELDVVAMRWCGDDASPTPACAGSTPMCGTSRSTAR